MSVIASVLAIASIGQPQKAIQIFDCIFISAPLGSVIRDAIDET